MTSDQSEIEDKSNSDSKAEAAKDAVTGANDMDPDQFLLMLSALAQPTRLEVYRMLSSAGEAGLVAGAIARAIKAPHNTLSTHLGILQRAGLIDSERSGRFIRYFIIPSCLGSLIEFLRKDCCSGDPTLCWPQKSDTTNEKKAG